MAVEKRLGLHHVPQRDPKLPGAEKGPKTQVPPAGFLRPGIRRHKGPAGRGPRWQGQGLSRRRNALRPPRAERGPPGARVASLSGQAPYTWGPGLGGSVSARGDPRTLPGRAPVPRSTKPTRLCKPETQVLSVIAGGSGTEKFPAALSTGVCLPDERSDGIRGEASGPARSPPRPGRPGVPALPCLPAPAGGRPEGAASARWVPARTSPGTPDRPPPEASESSFGPGHRLRSLRRRPAGCWAAVSFLLTSGAASRGRGRLYLHKGRAGPERRAPAAPPPGLAPPPGTGPAPSGSRPSRRGRRAGALGEAGLRSGQSTAPSRPGAGLRPA